MERRQTQEKAIKAYRRLKHAVDSLVKWERRGWESRIPEAQELVKQRRREYIELLEQLEQEQMHGE